MPSFFFEPPPPPPQATWVFPYTPLPPFKKERKKRKRRHQLWHYYIAQTNNEFKLRFDCYCVLTNWLICSQTWSHQSVTWEGRVSGYFWRGYGLNLVSQSNQTQRKQFRSDVAEMEVSTLGGSGGMLPRKIVKFSFSKMHISRILWENWQKDEWKITLKMHMQEIRDTKCRKTNSRKPFVVLKLCP